MQSEKYESLVLLAVGIIAYVVSGYGIKNVAVNSDRFCPDGITNSTVMNFDNADTLQLGTFYCPKTTTVTIVPTPTVSAASSPTPVPTETVPPETMTPTPVACGECDGKIRRIVFQYKGSISPVLIRIEQPTLGYDGSKIVFNGYVNYDQIFSVDGTIGNLPPYTLGTNIYIYVNNGDIPLAIHTSCSDPNVKTGSVYGDFYVIDAYSRNNDRICP